MNSWHQDFEFGPLMDIFGPVEPEIWPFEISLIFLVWWERKRIVIIILIFFHFCYFNTHETSNCHNSGSSEPKIFIRGPNSRSWCHLSDLLNNVMFLTVLTLVLAGNSNAFLVFLHFAGLKGQYTSKLLLGLENGLKTKVFTCIKKITKMRLMRYRIMKKERFFDIFRLGRPRVANLTPGIDSLRNFTSIIYFWNFFFLSI